MLGVKRIGDFFVKCPFSFCLNASCLLPNSNLIQGVAMNTNLGIIFAISTQDNEAAERSEGVADRSTNAGYRYAESLAAICS
jgi:hypothetical protein